MDNYLIPANSKKGQLIFNIFRWSDLLLLIMGAFVTVILMFVFQGQDTLIMMFVKLLPLGVCLLLVMPLPYYHNVLVFVQEMYIFFTTRRIYYCKGWCATSGLDEQQK